MSIVELHDALINKTITPLELTNLVLKLAKEDDTNGFEYICEKEAIEQAKMLNDEEPEKDNLLWAIPFVIKDNFSTKDIETTGSSKLLEGYVPVFSSEVYLRLLANKAICIGKTTLDELAMGGTGSSGHKGKTYNPWDKNHTRQIGGSSCGSASICANGVVPFAIGSDTGDSVRKPAGYGGLVGMKPTWGRISRFGLFPFSISLDHVAYFTRNVFDSALLLNVLAGKDEKDPTSSNLPIKDYTKCLKDNQKYKIAVIKEIYDEISDTCVINAFTKSLNYLKSKGYEIEFVSMDEQILNIIYPVYYIISSSEGTSNNANLTGVAFGKHENASSYDDLLIKTRTAGFSDRIKRRFVIGSVSLLKENQNEIYLRALKCRRLIVDAFKKVFEKYAAIYLPAAPSIAPLLPSQVPSKSFNKDDIVADNYLAFANMGGFPSITIPIGFEDGMPLGANITADIFNEEIVLNIAHKVENGTSLANIIAGDKDEL